jgi:hypothetical protein
MHLSCSDSSQLGVAPESHSLRPVMAQPHAIRSFLPVA